MHQAIGSGAGNNPGSNSGASHTGSLIELVKFEPWHLDEIIASDETGEYGRLKNMGCLSYLTTAKWCFTGIGRGKALGIAGVTPFWPGRSEAFALFGKPTKGEFLSFHRAISRFLSVFPGRVEMVVVADWEKGNRWARMLGFLMEAKRLKNYFPNGADATMYARVT